MPPVAAGRKAIRFHPGNAAYAWAAGSIPSTWTIRRLCIGVPSTLCRTRRRGFFSQGVTTDQFNHAPAQLFVHTGSPRLGRPSIGSWVTYGLGSETQSAGFVVLTSGGKTPDAGKSVWGSGFLPSVYQGVQCRSEGDPVLFLSDPEGVDRALKKQTIEAINEVNHKHYLEYNDPERSPG